MRSLALTLSFWVPVASAQTAILQLQVIEGEGAVHGAGSKSQRPVILQVTDETGRPVEGAAVSFLLPEEQGAKFQNGLKTEILLTDHDGRVLVRGILWGRSPGTVRMRVTAAKDSARAGTIVSQYVTDAPAPTSLNPTSYWTAANEAHAAKPRSKWMMIGLLAGVAVGGGLAMALAKGSSAAAAAAAAAAAPATAIPAVKVGAASITIGKP
ncbi:MAG: hypothetical protein JJE04_24250 [Acidobacteriia bacterium]|nr:hypothetical protein [Terriglobia bacterium]